MRALPQDTLFEREPEHALTREERDLMKALYLTSPPLQELAGEQDWSPTELIDIAEGLRRDGLLRIEAEEYPMGTLRYRVSLTPSGAAEAWLSKARGE